MSKKLDIVHLQCVSLTEIVPPNWHEWFFETLSGSSGFTWGTNNFSLVDVDSFLNYCDETFHGSGFVNNGTFKAWFKKMQRLPKNVYIDLES